MAIKPILFNIEMVRAILDGRKTQTRRVVRDKDIINSWDCESDGTQIAYVDQSTGERHPLTAPCSYRFGDVLWVRETWCKYGELDDWDRLIDGTEKFYYKADGENPTPFNQFLVQRPGWDEYAEMPIWHPSIHMPKEAARIFLRVTGVRVERLNDMSEEDAIDEGFAESPAGTDSPLERFCAMWDKTIKREDLREYGAHSNPWVWVIEFERCEKPEGWCE